MKSLFICIMASVSCLLLAPRATQAQLVSDYFTRTTVSGGVSLMFGAPRTFFAPFSGDVEVEISGSWIRYSQSTDAVDVVDAFYVYEVDGGPLETPIPRSNILGMRYTGCTTRTCAPQCTYVPDCQGAICLNTKIVFIEGVGFVAPGPNVFPPYRPDHKYHLVISLGPFTSYIAYGAGSSGFTYEDLDGFMAMQFHQLTMIPTEIKKSSWGQVKAQYR